MNVIEILTKISKVNAALNSNDYGQLALALGMSKAMVEEMSVDEVIQAMTVRMADLNRELEKRLNHE
jgi:predicted amidohydrolase